MVEIAIHALGLQLGVYLRLNVFPLKEVLGEMPKITPSPGIHP
jgi:hypothetical protein